MKKTPAKSISPGSFLVSQESGLRAQLAGLSADWERSSAT